MTKEQEIKNNLCNYINNLNTHELFIVTSKLEEFDEPKIPDSATFTCDACKNIFGECNIEDDICGVSKCEKRFVEYCNKNC